MQTFLNVAIWMWLAKIVPLHMRGPGIGISVFFGWTLNDSLALFHSTLVGAVGISGPFFPFAAVGVLALILVLSQVPETPRAGRTLPFCVWPVTDPIHEDRAAVGVPLRASSVDAGHAGLRRTVARQGRRMRVMNRGGGEVDTHTPMGSMVFTVMAALAQMELEIKGKRITDSVATRRAAGKDLGGRRPTSTDSQIRSVLRRIDAGEPATQAACDLGMSRATLYRRMRELSLSTTA